MRSEKYGARIRRLHDSAINAKNSWYECPKCHKKKVKRKGNSLWKCRSCGATFAGGAYSLNTEIGDVAIRLINEYSKTIR